MDGEALIASRTGAITRGLPALVAARGYENVERVVTNRPENKKYGLPPATLDRAVDVVDRTEDAYIVVDGDLHPGQMLDLRARLPAATVRDRKSAVWERLRGANRIAGVRFELRQCRIERLAAARADRDAAASSPSGSSGRRADLERRRDELRAQLERFRRADGERVANGYRNVDGHVVFVGRPGTATTDCWTALTGTDAPTPAGRPARAKTATADIGPHTVAVTETPGIPGDGAVPAYVEAVAAGTLEAIERADLVVGVGAGTGSLVESLSDQTDAACRRCSDIDEIRDTVLGTLDTVAYRLRLPYGDATHALVAELHDDALVREVAYDDDVVVRVEVSAAAADTLTRRVDDIGGGTEPADPGWGPKEADTAREDTP